LAAESSWFVGSLEQPCTSTDQAQEHMREQSEACGTEIISQTVAKVDLKSRPFKFWLHPMGDDVEIEEEEHTADSIIIATGAKARRLDLPGEEKYWGFGVSACAVCDGSLPMFRDQPLVVIGGGDSAVEEALYLTKKAKKVTVLVRRDKLRASRTNARRLTTHPKIEVLYNTSASEIKGEDKKNGLMTSLVVFSTLWATTPRLRSSRVSSTWMRTAT
jgi:thioredoxin reductase (NADPH)